MEELITMNPPPPVGKKGFTLPRHPELVSGSDKRISPFLSVLFLEKSTKKLPQGASLPKFLNSLFLCSTTRYFFVNSKKYLKQFRSLCSLRNFCPFPHTVAGLRAFTLAEVLITLAIIGVVAALTIPTVVNNYQKTQTITRLKKAYNALANTTNLAIANEGPIEGWEAEPNKSEEFANKYIIPYLKVAKNCGYQTTGDCAYNCTGLNGDVQNIDSHSVRFFLNDGIFVALQVYGGINEEGITRKRAIVYIDTNGQKKPNVLGKDIFVFLYYITTTPGNSSDNGKFMPIGYGTKRTTLIGDTLISACNKQAQGTYCATLIMQDGWQIKDDYPW